MGTFDDSFIDIGPGSVGPRTGFFEGISSGFDQQFQVEAEYALQQEVLNRWNENLELLEQRTGKKYERQTPEAIDLYIRKSRGEELTSFQQTRPDLRYFAGSPEAYKQLADPTPILEAQNAEFVAAGLPELETIFNEVVALQKKVEARSAQVAEGGGAGAFLGQLIGGVGGSFSTRDPTLLSSLLIPVGGTSAGAGNIARRIALEGLIGGATEANLHFNAVAQNRALAGLPERDPLQSILLAAGGAAAFRGLLFEAPAAGFRALSRNADPGIRDISFDDAQLRQFLGGREGSPSARAGLADLDDAAALASASPYGTTYQGLRRFTEEVAQTELALLGRSDTAVARVLPDLPRETLEREADFAIVREISPEVASRYDAAQARIAEIDSRVSAIGEELQARTVLDAVRLVDEVAATQLERLAARTDIPEAAKSLEADIIFNRVGKDRILKAAEDAEIAPRKETQRLRQQRKAANKELRLAARAMEAERAKLTAAADKVKKLAQGEATDLLGYAIQTRPPQGSKLASERVVAQREAIAKDADTVADRAIEAAARAYDPESELIEIAPGVIVRSDFLVPDEAGNPVPVGTLMRDFNEDGRLIEAMRSCAL